MNKSGKYLVWTALSVLGAFALGYIALNRGEQINALWIVVASVCVYLIAYRFYGLYIAKKVLAVDPTRMTPAVRHNDGLDYVPTDKKVLFGHHFAAIAGAGPLVGPVLAAQMGYLPGMIWLLAGVVLAGAAGCALWWKRRRALLLRVARPDKRNVTRLYSEKFNFFKRRTQGVWR